MRRSAVGAAGALTGSGIALAMYVYYRKAKPAYKKPETEVDISKAVSHRYPADLVPKPPPSSAPASDYTLRLMSPDNDQRCTAEEGFRRNKQEAVFPGNQGFMRLPNQTAQN